MATAKKSDTKKSAAKAAPAKAKAAAPKASSAKGKPAAVKKEKKSPPKMKKMVVKQAAAPVQEDIFENDSKDFAFAFAASMMKEQLAAVRAAMEQLQKQLEQFSEGDVEGLEVQKQTLAAEKTRITTLQKQLHTRITTNETAGQNISRKAAEMEKLDETYGWMKALSDTANGNVTDHYFATFTTSNFFHLIILNSYITKGK